MLDATDVTVAYDGTLVLDGVALAAGPGQVVGLIGPNGSGKTTLLRTLYRSLRPQSGSVTLDGRSLEQLSTREVARLVAVVAQEVPAELPLTVAEMVLLGRSPTARPSRVTPTTTTGSPPPRSIGSAPDTSPNDASPRSPAGNGSGSSSRRRWPRTPATSSSTSPPTTSTSATSTRSSNWCARSA